MTRRPCQFWYNGEIKCKDPVKGSITFRSFFPHLQVFSPHFTHDGETRVDHWQSHRTGVKLSRMKAQSLCEISKKEQVEDGVFFRSDKGNDISVW